MLIELLTDKYPGMRFWLTQRLTALVMAVYLVLVILLFVIVQPKDFDAWRAFVAPIWFKLATILFFASVSTHAWLGVRDVLRDYVFHQGLRGYLQIVVDVLLVFYFVWLSFILWNI